MKKILLISLLTMICTISFAQIQWQENGVPVRQGENISWNETSVACEDGAFVSFWTDTRNGISGIYAQKVDENGNLFWNNDGIEIYNPARIQTEPIAISSTDNSVIVCWRDHDEDEIYSTQLRLQKISANGELLWSNEGVLLEESGSNNHTAKLIPHNDGGVYVAWNNYSSANVAGIRLLANGSIATGWEQGLNLMQSSYLVDVFSDQMDGLIVAAVVGDDIYLQRVDENGNKLWGNLGMLFYNGNENIIELEISSTTASEYYISWFEEFQSSSDRIMLQKADSTGVPVWNTPITISEIYSVNKLMTVCSSGSQPIVTWVDGEAIFSQKIDSNGNFLWGEDGILVFESNYDLYGNSVIPKIDDENLMIIYTNYSDDDVIEICMQRIDDSGNLLFGDEGLIVAQILPYDTSISYSSLAYNGERSYLCWFLNRTDPQTLKNQIVDDDGNIYLEENGDDMYTGISGGANDIKLLPNENDPIMLWVDERDRNNSQIYLQKLNENGNNIFTEDGIPLTSYSGNRQDDLEVVWDENSEYIVAVWTELIEGLKQIFTQAIDTSGNLIWADSSGIQISTPGYHHEYPKISISNENSCYYGWNDYTDSSFALT